MRVPALLVASVVGAALMITACSSGSGSPQKSSASSTSHPKSGFAVGPNPCLLVTSGDIATSLNEQMVKENGSRSTCSYRNAATGDYLSVSTATTSKTAAEQAVNSAAATAGVPVHNLPGVGDAAVGYVTTTKTGSVATCVLAKNGTIVFMYGGGQNAAANPLLLKVAALAKTAVGRV